MNWVTIQLKGGSVVVAKGSDVTPSGTRMFNTSSDQLLKILNGDGRDIYVCRNYSTIIFTIKSYDIVDFSINGFSIKESEEGKDIHHGCPWLHSLG